MFKQLQKYTYIASIICIICIGVILRIQAYIYNRSFWHDDSALALNLMDRGLFDLFTRALDYVQCAPFLFITLNKFMVQTFGDSEFVFRFLPLVFGIASLFVFYILSKSVLEKKWTILVANYIFCTNYRLIYYSHEFKQYSLEVLITILTILYLSKLDIKDISIKHCLIIGILFFVMFLFSMPSAVILAAFTLYILLNNSFLSPKCALKQIFFISLPFLLLSLPYYFIYLAPNRKMMLECFYWKTLYTSVPLNYITIKHYISHFYNYMFYPNYNAIPPLILTIAGLFYTYKNKTKTSAIILFILLSAVLLSIMHIYPLYERIGLYVLPLFILVMTKPLDRINLNFKKIICNKAAAILNLFFLVLFCFYFRLNCINYLKSFLNKDIFCNGYFYRQFIENIALIKTGQKTQILTDEWYKPPFYYYLRRFNINSDEVIILKEYGVSKVTEILDNLPNDKDYWLYQYDYKEKSNASYTDVINKWFIEKKPLILFDEIVIQKKTGKGVRFVHFRTQTTNLGQ